MTFMKPVIFSLVCMGIVFPASAADFSDPTWPCVQRKVGTLSLGLMWPQPIDESSEIADASIRKDIEDLADTLALRRVELDAMRPAVEDFATRHNGDPELLGRVFARVFNSLNKRRSRIISGIGDFSMSQIALAEQIEAARVEMSTLLDATEPDFDRVDVLEEQLDWDQLIHSDRQRSIQYLCETPVILEQRLFGIAQMLLQLAQDPS